MHKGRGWALNKTYCRTLPWFLLTTLALLIVLCGIYRTSIHVLLHPYKERCAVSESGVLLSLCRQHGNWHPSGLGQGESGRISPTPSGFLVPFFFFFFFPPFLLFSRGRDKE